MKLKELLDRLFETQIDIKVSQARMEEDLKHHIKRTDLLETKVISLDEDVEKVTSHMSMLRGFLKYSSALTGVVATLLGVAWTLSKLLSL